MCTAARTDQANQVDNESGELTQWLRSLQSSGEPVALPDGLGAVSEAMFVRLYADIKRSARAALRHERDDHTLSATALVNEAWLRMAEQTRVRWQSRGHFLAVAATMMRRILVNHAVARRTAKREAELLPLTLAGLAVADPGADRDVVAIHEALLAFEALDPRAAKVVEMRYFGGLENDEIAVALDISAATVKRDWTVAKAWLHRELKK